MLENWLNYVLEALGLGTFMVSAGLFATLLYTPTSPATTLIPNEGLRGLLMGVAMGLTAIAIIYSPGGKRSGAHINPAVTLTFYRLHKIRAYDALAYVTAQVVGGLMGVGLVAIMLGDLFTQAPVNYVVTRPGMGGEILAFIVEVLMSFVLMLMILFTSNIKALSNLTGILAGILLAIYIPFATPISGMSLNPARTFASAIPAQEWTGLWLYFIAPPLAMLLAAQVYLWNTKRTTREICCKLCPNPDTPCISHRCCVEDISSTRQKSC